MMRFHLPLRLPSPKPPKPSERGAALLAAIFMVALMAAAAAAATEEIRYAVRRAANVEARDQAQWYALGAESLARARLADADGDERALLERAAAEGRSLGFPIEGGQIVATLREAQSCFNLNSLVQPGEGGFVAREGAAEEYVRLLTLLDIPSARARAMAGALTDWLDGDSRVTAQGAEDGAYAAAPTPYRAANTLLAETEELRAVAGYDEALFAAIRPFVCAQADSEPGLLNVATLRPDQAALLAAFYGEELTLAEAREIIGDRPASGYADIEQFRLHPRLIEIALDEDEDEGEEGAPRLTLTSNRFVLLANVAYRGAEVRLESVLLAPPGAPARVAFRRFGEME